jgi:hypothetical protein
MSGYPTYRDLNSDNAVLMFRMCSPQCLIRSQSCSAWNRRFRYGV